jgi:hypothetical protein
MNGNTSLALGVLASGMDICAMYPITPATSVSHYLSDCFERVHRLSDTRNGSLAVDFLHSALVALKLGDGRAFFSARDDAITRFVSTTDSGSARYVISVALLRPVEQAAALEPLVRFLQTSLAAAGSIQDGTTSEYAWHRMLLGLWEYRRGNYTNALEWCQRSRAISAFVAMPTATDCVIMAMCDYKLGHARQAKIQIEKARSLAQTGLNTGFDAWNWREWVYFRLLLEEAPLPRDPQGLLGQVARLEAAGVEVLPSNAEAARFAALLLRSELAPTLLGPAA